MNKLQSIVKKVSSAVKLKNQLVKWNNERIARNKIHQEAVANTRNECAKQSSTIRSLAGYIHDLNNLPTREMTSRFGKPVYTKHTVVYKDHLTRFRKPIGA